MSGDSNVIWKSNSAAVSSAILDGAKTGMQAAGDKLLALSQAVVPVDTGELRDSGQVTATGNDQLVQVAVSYDAPQAVIQHEHMEYNHPNGGQAKFLEQPMFAAAEELAQIVADAVHAQVGGPR